MKTLIMSSLTGTFALMLATTGCGPSNRSTPADHESGTNTTARQESSAIPMMPEQPGSLPTTGTKVETDRAAVLAEQKPEFIAAAKGELTQLDVSISNLVHKATSFTGPDRADADQTLAKLHEQRADLGDLYDKLSDATTETWGKTRSHFSLALTDLRSGCAEAAVRFRTYDTRQMQTATPSPNAN